MARTNHAKWSLLLRKATILAIVTAPILVATVVFVASLQAQDSEPGLPSVSDELAIEQSRLAEQHARLEKLLLRMAEFDATSNPRRAELLKKAFALSKEQDIQLQLSTLSRLLNQEKFKRAIDGQKTVRSDLSSLLELLLSENRADRLKDEQTRIRSYIKEIERLERIQRGVQGRNEGGVEAKQLAKEQQRVADQTQALSDQIEENEGGQPGPTGAAGKEQEQDAEPADKSDEQDGDSREGDQKSSDSEPSDSEPSDSEPSDSEPSDSEPSDSEPSDSEPSDSEPSDSEPSDSEPSDSEPESSEGQPSAGQSSESQPSPGQPSPSQPAPGQPQNGQPNQPQQESFPGQKQVQQAEQRMREAQDKLDQAERDEAREDQQEAARKLAEAKAELEEILRQMREEEIERTLAQLESRVRKMLEMELQIQENTTRLARRQAENADRVLDIEAGKLSFQQRRVVVEADKCLAVLREEGSSVAFPASMEQVREDMEEVVTRLAEVKLGPMTQGLEEDIIEALEEMIEALQQAQADQEQRQQDPANAPPAAPGEQPLVNQIAELKMIKALQFRINKRTDRYSKMLDNVDDLIGQANDDELIDALRGLAERELDLHQITRDISLGKNQ